MNALVFATYDVTPEQWDDFATNAGIRPSKPDDELLIPYFLVHSRSQEQDLRPEIESETKFETKKLKTTVKTEFASATWHEIRDLLPVFAKPNTRTIHTTCFLMLDKHSPKDRKVVMVEKGLRHITPDGKEWFPLPSDRSDLRLVTTWTKWRVPYEEGFKVCCAMTGFGPPCEEVNPKEWLEESTEQIDEEPGSYAELLDRWHNPLGLDVDKI